MSLGNTLYLAMVVAGFCAMGAVLFWGWLWTNWSSWFPSAQARATAPAKASRKSSNYSKAA